MAEMMPGLLIPNGGRGELEAVWSDLGESLEPGLSSNAPDVAIGTLLRCALKHSQVLGLELKHRDRKRTSEKR